MHFFPLLYLEGEWSEMERRQAGGKADESVFFFWMGRTWAACWVEQEKGAKGGSGEAGVLRGEPSHVEGAKRSLQTFIIPLLLMWSQAQQNAASQTQQSFPQLTVFRPRCPYPTCRSAWLAWLADFHPSYSPGQPSVLNLSNIQPFVPVPVWRASARRVKLSSVLIPLGSQPLHLAPKKASCVLAEPCTLPWRRPLHHSVPPM